MKFELETAIPILERTPTVLRALLQDLPEKWIRENEGEDTWSPFDVVGHLIHGEKTDWMIRTALILEKGSNPTFEPFDRFAQFENSKGKTVESLLDEFEGLRKDNLTELKSRNLTSVDYGRTGIHPEFGEVTLAQLLSAWVVHDLGHIAQISRTMAKQYKNEVGPWTKYLTILNYTPKE
ncbi:DinB family protein [Ulvibacterium marinum]|uniref:DinB family protein n=1 Tax=Ulvibacterium marinum TaxID=2419782 RepID=A0A3B0C495_9FLAO|nr:DinB family protein [Ulvibacterium marinum]RKN79301.1 DinB family protein [Ulvibacterium marinum]